MIGKMIRMNRRQRRAVERRLRTVRKSIFALTRYIVDADPYGLIAETADDILSISDYALAVRTAGVEPGEKVEAFGIRNLAGDHLGEWQAQMLAVAARATGIKIPVIHLILSLRETETWTAEQREEAITIVLETLGLERCQMIWAEHSNTSHPHLHLSVLRIDPESARAAGSEWLIDDLHQAMAIIEERQGRVREPHALYVARGGAVYDVETNALVRDADGQFMAGWYKDAGKKRTWLPPALVQRRAELIDAASDACSWRELHDALGELGVCYDKAGSGARICAVGVSAKASEVHASLSRPELEKRLGAFEPDLTRLDPAYEAYRQAQVNQLAMLRRKRDDEKAAVDNWRHVKMAELPQHQSKRFAPAIRQEAEEAKKALAAAFKLSIQCCTAQRLTREKWIAAGRPEAPEPVSVPGVLLPSLPACAQAGPGISPEFERHEIGRATEYRDAGGQVVFTDHRALIVVHAANNAEAIDAALRLAHDRWGRVRVTGPSEFVELATKRAHVLGIAVFDADGRPPLSIEEPTERQGNAQAVGNKPASSAARTMLPTKAGQRALVESALSYLKNIPELPIRRRAMPGDNERTGRTGPLEIVVGDFASRDLRDHAVTATDDRVQAFLKQKYDAMILSWEEQILERCPGRLPVQPERVIRELSPDGSSRLLAQVALGDAEFTEMLKRLERKLLGRKPRNLPPTAVLHPQVATQNSRSSNAEYEEAKAMMTALKDGRSGQGV